MWTCGGLPPCMSDRVGITECEERRGGVSDFKRFSNMAVLQ